VALFFLLAYDSDMANVTKEQESSAEVTKILQNILLEIQLLRREMTVEDDSLETYANAERVKDSYQQAQKEYPPETE
jgi:hypothetical protein